MPSYVRAGIRKCARIRALSVLGLGLVLFTSLMTHSYPPRYTIPHIASRVYTQ